MYACGSSLGRNRGFARLTDDDKKITRVFSTSRVMTPHPSESLALPLPPSSIQDLSIALSSSLSLSSRDYIRSWLSGKAS